jgi:hypothetical protein
VFGFSYSAFCELNSDRESGFGLGPIRFTAIDAYASRYRITGIDEFEEFVSDVRLIDRMFLDLIPKPNKDK